METTTALARPKAVHRKPRPDRKVYARSKITNGTDGAVLPNVDGRSLIARRFRDISEQIVADQAGRDQCSETRLQLIRRFAAAAVLAEQLEARLANGEDISIIEHSQLASTMVRIAQRIGVNRILRDVTTLEDYLNQHH